MANKIAFVTDSTACLTEEQIQSGDIHVVPLSVVLAGTAYREGIDITSAEFYDKMASTTQFPTTSQPAIGEFVQLYDSLLQNHETVLCYMMSSRLSGTCQTAMAAAKMVEGDIHVIDSLISSYGISGPLLDGVELAKQGAGPEAVLSFWEEVRERVKSMFVLDTLEYLHRGGRIGGAAAAFGAMLQIKPILTVRDGRIEVFEKVRTHRRAMETMLRHFDEDAIQGEHLQVGVVHSRRQTDAEELRNSLVNKYPNISVEISELGPVIGCHTGPGVLALVYYPRTVAR